MANDDFNFTPEDLSNISKTFEQSARMDRDEREKIRKGRDGGGFWSGLGKSLVGGIVQQAVVEPITESVAGFINRPFADRENVFLKSLREDTTKGQRLARERAKVDLSLDTKWQGAGLNDVQRAANSLMPSIQRSLKQQARRGTLTNSADAKISMQELVDNDLLNTLAEELATQSVTANNNAGVNAYNAKIDAGRLLDLTPAGDASLKKHYAQFNNLSQNWVDKGFNMLRNKSPEDLINIATEKIKTTDRYKRNEEVRAAIGDWDKFQNPESLTELTNANSMAELWGRVDSDSLENVVGQGVTTRTKIDDDKNSPTYRQEVTAVGIWRLTQKPGEPAKETFIPNNKGWLSTTTAQDAISLYGDPTKAINNLGGISEKKKRQLMQDLDAIELNGESGVWRHLHLPKNASQTGALKAIKSVFDTINAVGMDENAFTPGYDESLRKAQIKSLGTLAAARTRLEAALADDELGDEDKVQLRNNFFQYREEAIRLQAGLNAKIVSVGPDGATAIPKYSVPALDGDGQIIPGRFAHDLTQGKTNGEHVVADLYFEKWQLSREPTQVEIDAVIKSTPNADELASVTARRRDEEIAKIATADQAAADAAVEVKATETAATDAAAIEAFNAIGLDGILEENTTIKEITRGRGRQERTTTERYLNEGVGHGLTLKATVNELGSRIPLEDTRSLLADMGLPEAPTNFKTINQWYTANKEKLATALATNKNLYSFFKEEGHAGLYRKFNNEYINRRK